MSRKRSRANQGLPDFLHYQDGQYVYRNRKLGLYARLGTDRAKAVLVANKTNARVMKKMAVADLEDRLHQTGHSFSACLDRFEEWLKGRNLAEGTLDNARWKIKKYRELWGERDIRDINVEDVSDQLDTLSDSAYVKHRQFLIDVWKVARAKGKARENPAEATLTKPEGKRQRQRLNIELFNKIRDHKTTPDWMKDAMDLSLLTLQARQEVRDMRFDNIKDGRLHVVRQKTAKKNEKAFLAIEVTPQLKRLISRCRERKPLSPYLVHYHPIHKVKCKRWPRKHWTQLTPTQLTDEFRRIRKLVDPNSTATFHEIRSLGSHLYRKQGVPEEHIQALLAHSSVKTSRYYMSGHEIEWSVVSPILEVQG